MKNQTTAKAARPAAHSARPTPSAVRLVLGAIVLASLLGVIAGFWFYRYQLASLPAFLWPFVMDSPFAGLLVGLAALFALKGVKNEFLNVLVFIAGIASLKIGVWALGALWLYAPAFFSPELALTSWFLVLTHFVQIGEGLLLMGASKARYWLAPVAASWFLVNDWLDYGPLNLHPQLPALSSAAAGALNVQLLGGIAILLSTALTFVFLTASQKRQKPFHRIPLVRRVQDALAQ